MYDVQIYGLFNITKFILIFLLFNPYTQLAHIITGFRQTDAKLKLYNDSDECAWSTLSFEDRESCKEADFHDTSHACADQLQHDRQYA